MIAIVSENRIPANCEAWVCYPHIPTFAWENSWMAWSIGLRERPAPWVTVEGTRGLHGPAFRDSALSMSRT
jgi:hypothetical protein